MTAEPTQPITQAELESYLWGAATLLRGTIDAGDYKQFIFPLLFWKRLCDVYDEETRHALEWAGEVFPEDHRFQIPEGAHWNDVRQVPSNIGMAIHAAMHAIETANPETLSDIFGDAPWTNKDRLSDETLRDLIENFSSQTLSTVRVTDDLLGKAYEFLIKKFADDSGHTAAEFYTNRTVVHLMALMLEPQPGESVYDPTCGSGGMLIEAAEKLKRERREYRTLKLYGQEVNLMTSAMARMNLFMHGFEDFRIVRGDTLAKPHFHTDNRLQQFDVVLANPPYSIKQWNRAAWENDLYGRNRYGTPPQGRADYAFFQHILASLKPDTGRCAILFPHGVLFREEERHMRNLLVQDDVIECIVGLGPNLFYNSPMEACVVICRMNKPERSRGRILFINAVNEVTRERAFSYLEDEHIERIVGAYRAFADIDGFARVVDNADVLANNANLNIPLYVQPPNGNNGPDKPLETVIAEWQSSSRALRESMDNLISEIQPPSHEHTIEVIPPDVFAAGMKGITIQLGEFSNLFAASHRQLSDVINIYGTQMAGLQMIARPDPYFLDAIANLLPQIETAQLAEGLGKIAGIDKSLASFSETFAKFIKPSIDVTELKLLAERFRDQSQVLESMKKTTDLFTSRKFADIATIMGVNLELDTKINDFLATFTANNGLELKYALGTVEYVEPTLSVLSDDLDVEDLPNELRRDVEKTRNCVYEYGISATVLMLWAINLMWVLSEKSFEAASSVVTTLLTLLIVLKGMAEEDKE